MARSQFEDETSGAREAGDWPIFPVALAFLALFAAMTARWLMGWVTIPWDAKAHFQPQIQFLAQSIARGEWPWWNPYVFAGQPQIADPQSMIFSPPFLLLALVNGNPSLWAVDVTVIAAMAAGGIGILVLFRDRGWHWAGGLVAALVFSFGAAMAWRMQHTGQVLSLAAWPWAFVLLDRALARGSPFYGALAGLVAAFIVLGRDQVALLAIYLLAAQALWSIMSNARPVMALRRAVLPLVAGGIVGLAVVTLPILMTVLLAAESNRPQIDFAGAGRGSLHPALLLTLLSPDVFGASSTKMGGFWGPPSFTWQGTDLYIAQNVGVLYVGALPVLFVLLSLVRGQLWAREVRLFTVALGFMLLYALGWFTPAFRAFYTVMPGIDLYRRPADAVFFIGALMGVIAGYGVHRLFATPWQRPERRGAWGVAAVLAAGGTLALLFGWRFGRVGDLILPLATSAALLLLAAGAIAWARSRLVVQPVMVGLVLAALTAIDLGVGNGFNGSSALPPGQYEAMEPDTRNATVRWLEARVAANESATRRDRVELAGLGFHWPNISMTHRLENTLGYNPVRLGITSRATGAEDHVGLPDQRKFSALMPSYRSPLADLLGLRWIATGVPIETIDKGLATGALPLRVRTPDAWIYENERALPRVLFATHAARADFGAMLRTGVWPAVDFHATVLLEDPPGADKRGRRPGTVAILATTNTRIEIEATSPDGGFVVLNDVWHPWWTATVDGARVPLLQANVLFRAVAVPPGRHRVVFEFRPLEGVANAVRQRIGR